MKSTGSQALEQSKNRSIWIYGNPDKSALGFPMPGDLTQYLKNDIFTKELGRYRYTQGKNADVIILSRDGVAFGHFDVERKEKPTDADRTAYPSVRFVYVVRTSHLYNQPVPLSQLSITVRQYGYKLSEAEFDELLKLANGSTDFHYMPLLPEEVLKAKTYTEGAVKAIIVNAYERNPEARADCIRHYGMKCAVCGLTMADLYGEVGETVIHVHHLRELASIGAEYKVDPIQDLRPVCPNCHSVLHTKSPALSIEQLRHILLSRKQIQ